MSKASSSSDGEPSKKKPKAGANVLHMGKEKFVSMSGIESLLNDVKKNGLPEHFSRKFQYNERKRFCHERTKYGPIVENLEVNLKGGKTTTIGVQNPMAMLFKACQTSQTLSNIMVERLAAHSPPWNIILYADGVSPSDGLTKHDRRKAVAFYWSFKEFGLAILHLEEVWFCVCSCRQYSIINQIDGGVSSLTRTMLEKLFFNDASHHFEKSGMILQLYGEEKATVPFTAKLGVLLMDMLALAELLLWKGHGGFKMCVCDKNVGLRSLMEPNPEGSGSLIPHTCLEIEKIIPHTDQSISAGISRLADLNGELERAATPKAKSKAKAKLQEAELVHGYNFNKNSLLMSATLNIHLISILMLDWMHIYLVGGLLDEEFGLCMKALHVAKSQWSYTKLWEEISKWTFPKRVGSLKNLFDPTSIKKHLKNAHFDASASELLSLVPVLSFIMCLAIGDGVCTAELQSLILLLDVVELLNSVRRGIVTPEMLEAAIMDHLAAFQRAYEIWRFRPKHHYAIHLPMMLLIFTFLLACFVHERHHKLTKKYMELRENTTSYEIGTIEDITIHQLMLLARDWLPHGFGDGREPSRSQTCILRELFPDARVFQVASEIMVDGLTKIEDVVYVMADDVVYVGELCMLVKVDDEAFAILHIWDLVEDGVTSSKHAVRDNLRVLPATSVLCSLTFRMEGDVVIVLKPPEYR